MLCLVKGEIKRMEFFPKMRHYQNIIGKFSSCVCCNLRLGSGGVCSVSIGFISKSILISLVIHINFRTGRLTTEEQPKCFIPALAHY